MSTHNKFTKHLFLLAALFVLNCFSVKAFERPEKVYSIFQFSQNKIPRIDGDFTDWQMIPDSFAIGMNELKETVRGLNEIDLNDKNITVKVGWVKGLNRLYFCIDSYDEYWSFETNGIRQDLFELVVDADLSGGKFIKKRNDNLNKLPYTKLHFRSHGNTAQNYHIFTPAVNKDWCMIWGNCPWLKDFPQANAAYSYNFKHGEAGRLKMEFWITPYNYSSIEGPEQSSKAVLKENDLIGLSWCILDYDEGNQKAEGFYNLAHNTAMIYDGGALNAFRLCEQATASKDSVSANWSFFEISRSKRIIQFTDQSKGDVKKWHWDFGDGTTSTQQNPQHTYKTADEWTVVLTIEGLHNKSVRSKVWDVVTE